MLACCRSDHQSGRIVVDRGLMPVASVSLEMNSRTKVPTIGLACVTDFDRQWRKDGWPMCAHLHQGGPARPPLSSAAMEVALHEQCRALDHRWQTKSDQCQVLMQHLARRFQVEPKPQKRGEQDELHLAIRPGMSPTPHYPTRPDQGLPCRVTIDGATNA